MPNNVDINLSVCGKQDKLDEFVKQAKSQEIDCFGDSRKESRKEICDLLFAAIVPPPEELYHMSYGGETEERLCHENGILRLSDSGYFSMYDWEIENWGVKWGGYNFKKTIFEPGIANYRFTCAWDAPDEFVEKASLKFPDLLFVLSYGGEGPTYGRFTYLNGRLLDSLDIEPPDCPENSNTLTEDDNEYWEKYQEWEQHYLLNHSEYVAEMRSLWE
jgi:hypothetical protein